MVKYALTYSKEIDLYKDNAVIIQVLCLFSQKLMVEPERINDLLGGYCGNPARDLLKAGRPKTEAVPVAANATAAKNATAGTKNETA